MGRTKAAMEQREESWLMKAEREGLRCYECGAVAIFDERDVYFDTGMCGSYAHIAAKID